MKYKVGDKVWLKACIVDAFKETEPRAIAEIHGVDSKSDTYQVYVADYTRIPDDDGWREVTWEAIEGLVNA